MAKLSPIGPFRALDGNGAPLSFGELWTYEAGTSTPKPTYTDASGAVANPNPVILDSEGYPASGGVWLDAGAYKLILKDANGVDVWPVPLDNVTGDSLNTFGAVVVMLSSTTTITSAYVNNFVVCDGTITLQLLPLSEAGEGFVLSVRNNGTGIVTLDPDSAELVNGKSSFTLLPGQSCIVISGSSGWFTIGSSSMSGVLAKAASYTVEQVDRSKLIAADATAGAMTINLPAAATAGDGFEITVKKTDNSANAVTIDPNGAELVEGAANLALPAQNDVVRLISNGTAWLITSRRIAGDINKTAAGLGNVQNVDQTNAANITSGTLSGDRLPTTLGGIGSFILAFYSGTIAPGATIAGSNLFPCSANATNQGAAQTGTWRAMGGGNGASSNGSGVTLYQRIS